MLKFLIILILVMYLIYRVGGFLFRVFFIGAQQRHYQSTYQQQPQSRSKRAPGSNLNIDHIPNKEQQDKKDFRGGEYVDFEEVK